VNPTEMPGKKIVNRYKVLEKIGGGGMSVVWKGYDLVLDRYVALKVLRPEMSEDEDFIRRFRREAKAAAGLSHPNIVSIYDVGEDQGLYFIVMELIEGETLRDRLRREGKLSLKEALSIAAEICEGLGHAHANKIIHRDVKPQNILITEQGHVKVADFGIARALGGVSTTSSNVVVGSAPYLSPEQAQNGVVSVRSDLYSLGVVVYEMLGGKPPFAGETPVAIALQHVEARVPSLKEINPEIPQPVEAFVQKALSKNPDQRFQSAEEMLLAIRSLLAMGFSEMPRKDENGGDENVAKTKKKRQPVSLSVKIFLAFLIVAFGLAGYAVHVFNKWMDVPIIEVPNVVGKSQLEAQSILRAQGFIPQLAAERYDQNFPANTVISQSPAGGEKAKKGREVYYVLSKGQEFVRIPDVTGKTLREAQLDLENVGLVLGNVEYEFHPSVEKDKVMRQNPRGETEVASGTRVDVTVSKGPMPDTAVVPSLVGYTKEQAEQKLKDALLELGKVSQVPGNEPFGIVLAQDPPAGQEVPVRSKVNISISLGTEKPAYTHEMTIQVPNKGRPVNVRVFVSDATEQNKKIYDKNENPGETIEVRFEYKGPQATVTVYFDGELASQSIIRPR